MINNNFPSNINIQKEYRERLTQSVERYSKKYGDDIGVSAYVNKIVRYYLDKEQWLREYQPEMMVLGISDSIMFIRDKTKSYRVKRVNNNSYKLKCLEDGDERCDHVIYAYASLDIVRLLMYHT